MREGARESARLGREVGRALSTYARAVRARHLYRTQNAVVTKMMTELVGQLDHVLQQTEELSLRVRSDAFVYEGEPVFSEPNPDESIPFAFYRDGVRRIDLYPGLTPEEIEVLVRAATHGISYTGLGDDVVTLLWRSELEHVRYVVVDTTIVDAGSLPPGGSEPPPGEHDIDMEIDGLLLAIYGGAKEDVGPRALHVDQSDVAAKWIADSLDRLDEMAVGFHPLRSPLAPPAYTSKLLKDIEAEHEQALTLRLLASCLDGLASPLEERDASSLFDTLLSLFDAAIVSNDLVLASRIVLGIRALQNYDHAREPAKSWLADAVAEARLQQLTSGFVGEPSKERAEAIGGFFRACGRAAAPALISLIPRIGEPQLRRMFSTLAAEIGLESVEPLKALLESEQAFVAQEAVFILGQLGTKSARDLLMQALKHPQPPVRLALVEVAPKLSRERAMVIARHGVDDPDPKVATRACALACALRDKGAAELIGLRLQDQERVSDLPREAKFALASALAVLSRAHAVPILGRCIRKGDQVLQLAAIAAMRTVPTPGAIAALKKACLSLNKTIREAAKQALTDIKSGAVS